MEFIMHTELPFIYTHVQLSWYMHCNVNIFYVFLTTISVLIDRVYIVYHNETLHLLYLFVYIGRDWVIISNSYKNIDLYIWYDFF